MRPDLIIEGQGMCNPLLGIADYLAGEEIVDVGEILTPLRITKLPPYC
jgi:hypothetical protein